MAHAFHSLPIEVNQMIGRELENDTDIGNYRLICNSTKDAIDGDEYSFWRKRFLDYFDALSMAEGCARRRANKSLKDIYMQRRRLLQQGANFESGSTTRDAMGCLAVMRDLIIDSFCGVKSVVDEGGRSCSVGASKNMEHISRFINNHNLLSNVCRPVRNNKKQNPLLLAIQLVLTHFSLTAEPDTARARAWSFSSSQQMAYLPSMERPILKGPSGLEVDVEWCLHIANFFKSHFLGKQEALYSAYNDLMDTERPQCWLKPLNKGSQKLGTHWKGAFAYVGHDELHDIRAGIDEEEQLPVQDQLNGQDGVDGFQTLHLSPKDKDMPWPPEFESVLHSLTKPVIRTKTRAQKRALGPDTTMIGDSVAFQFQGQVHDNREHFQASGWLNPLPPQQGIPGWMRMTMMKYNVEANSSMNMGLLWAYEGVVLPGGMIMLGRWWHPGPGQPEDEYTGPFIFFNVDSSIDEAELQATGAS